MRYSFYREGGISTDKEGFAKTEALDEQKAPAGQARGVSITRGYVRELWGGLSSLTSLAF
jgi:hypothetical protein